MVGGLFQIMLEVLIFHNIMDNKYQRHKKLSGQVNSRDLGGYKTVDGRTIRWGQVFRSGRLPKLSDDDVDHVASLGIRTVVSLLTEDDIDVYGPIAFPLVCVKYPCRSTAQQSRNSPI